jgi:excisionase family DNA binding protein
MEDRLLYRVPEVALILNISRSKVYELFASGELESVKIDRIRLVRSSDLRMLISSTLSTGLPDRLLSLRVTSHNVPSALCSTCQHRL